MSRSVSECKSENTSSGGLRSYRITFNQTTYEIQSPSHDLKQLLELVHQRLSPSTSSIPVPDDFSVWLRWKKKKNRGWVEVIDSNSLQMALDDVEYQAITAEGGPIELDFRIQETTSPIIALSENETTYHKQLTILKGNKDLYQRLQFLICDLLHLKDEDRWSWDIMHNLPTYPYLPSLYFKPDEQLFLSTFPTREGSIFVESIGAVVSSKFGLSSSTASSSGAHVCSSHDLAPCFREIFDLGGHFYKDEKFRTAHAAFEKSIQKRMKASRAPSSLVTHSSNSSTTSSSNPSVAASNLTPPLAIGSTLPPDHPKLMKLHTLKAKLEALESKGQTDKKLVKDIQLLEKEVERIEKKGMRIEKGHDHDQ